MTCLDHRLLTEQNQAIFAFVPWASYRWMKRLSMSCLKKIESFLSSDRVFMSSWKIIRNWIVKTKVVAAQSNKYENCLLEGALSHWVISYDCLFPLGPPGTHCTDLNRRCRTWRRWVEYHVTSCGWMTKRSWTVKTARNSSLWPGGRYTCSLTTHTPVHISSLVHNNYDTAAFVHSIRKR